MSSKVYRYELIFKTLLDSFLLGVASRLGSKEIRSSTSKVLGEGTTADSVGLATLDALSGEVLWGALRRNYMASMINRRLFSSKDQVEHSKLARVTKILDMPKCPKVTSS